MFGATNISDDYLRIIAFKLKNLRNIALVESPNVRKSVIFNKLTGLYTTISNYPGTTVDVSSGRTQIGEEDLK